MKVYLLIVFVGLSAFFSGVETAFISLSKLRIQHLLRKKKKGIRLVKELLDNNQRLIITILIGNNLVNIAASSIGTAIAIDMFKSNAIGIAVGIMTLIILVFGEITPKTIAMNKNEWIAIKSAPIIKVLEILFFPVIVSMEKISRGLSFPLSKKTRPIITEEEIKSVISLGKSIGEVEEDEMEMIHNIFRFSDLEASDIMTPRISIFALDSNRQVSDVIGEIEEKGYSRIPVYEKKIDKIIGILYAKDVLYSLKKKRGNEKIKEIMRPAIFIPETMMIDDLLRKFQKEKVHIAMVVDDYGGISGLISIEDLLEEIVGEIYDETDTEKIGIKKISAHKSIVDGKTEIKEVNRALNLKINEEEDYETISSLILGKLRKLPKVGENIMIEDVKITVTKVGKQKIIEVEIER